MDQKEKVNEARVNLDMVTKNVMNAVYKDLEIEYNIEAKKDGTFLILITAQKTTSP